jgi:hypothetical protein
MTVQPTSEVNSQANRYKHTGSAQAEIGESTPLIHHTSTQYSIKKTHHLSRIAIAIVLLVGAFFLSQYAGRSIDSNLLFKSITQAIVLTGVAAMRTHEPLDFQHLTRHFFGVLLMFSGACVAHNYSAGHHQVSSLINGAGMAAGLATSSSPDIQEAMKICQGKQATKEDESPL